MLTIFLQAESTLDAGAGLHGGAGCLLVNEATAVTKTTNGTEEGEENEEEKERLGLINRNASLNVQLGKNARSGDGLSKEGGGESEHGHAADEELVLLGETESAGGSKDAILDLLLLSNLHRRGSLLGAEDSVHLQGRGSDAAARNANGRKSRQAGHEGGGNVHAEELSHCSWRSLTIGGERKMYGRRIEMNAEKLCLKLLKSTFMLSQHTGDTRASNC